MFLVCLYYVKVFYVFEFFVRIFMSLNYFLLYDSNVDCKWIFEVFSEFIVEVIFQVFELVGDMYFYSFCCDKFIFYDGNDIILNIFGIVYCGVILFDLIYFIG